MSKKTKVSDIAELSGVSPATVSRVINHPELVKSDTVTIVHEAMLQLGYEISQKDIEKAQHNKGKDIIIINVQDINNIFYGEILNGADISAKSNNCDLIITQYVITKNNLDDFLNLVKNVNADGVILLSRLDKGTLDKIAEVTKLVQCCEYNTECDYPYVSINNYSSAKIATEYLIASGRNKIAFINGPISYQYAIERRRGFMDAMDNAGLNIRQNWMLQIPKMNFDIAYASVCQMLDSRILPNAIFAVSDVLAAAAIKAVHHFNLKVPQDISVVGFDNIPFCNMSTPSITTVSQPAFQLGYSACEMLIESISSPDTASKSLLLNTEFIIRDSTSFQINANSY